MFSTIQNRRSIRSYQSTPIPREMILKILEAGRLAPSSKNRQPWRFVVVQGQSKKELLHAMRRGLAREKVNPLLPESAHHLAGAEYTLQIMAVAPVLLFVLNPLGLDLRCPITPEERVYELCNAQSLGAAMENMTLTATALGLGSLWICDTYFAYDELSAFLDGEGTLCAALAVGYAAEAPTARPRRPLSSLVRWCD